MCIMNSVSEQMPEMRIPVRKQESYNSSVIDMPAGMFTLKRLVQYNFLNHRRALLSFCDVAHNGHANGCDPGTRRKLELLLT